MIINVNYGSSGTGGGADISTSQVFVANFYSDSLRIVSGTVDPLSQFIYTV